MSSAVIAIDGPAASGKSTVASRVAAIFGIPVLNTGSIFRLIAYDVLSRKIDLTENNAPEFLAGLASRISWERKTGEFEFSLENVVIASELRLPEVASCASRIAAIPAVRSFVLEIEHRIAADGWLVMEGRDIGTAVFPDAGYKFFVFASPYERARRRLAQAGEVAEGATLDSVAAEIAARDEFDSKRAVAPLKAADDAVVVDTTDMSIDAAVKYVVERIGSDVVA